MAFRGQPVALVVAETSETARQAAELVQVSYAEQPHETELRAGFAAFYKPDQVNPSFETDTADGDVAAAMAAAPVTLEQTYTTAMNHNNPLEPHASTALWEPAPRCRSPCGTPPRGCTRPGRPWPRCSGSTRSGSG